MILDKFRIDGQLAMITGGTKGLGKAISMALAEAGADIVVVTRTPDSDLGRMILGLGRRYLHYAADLSHREETHQVIPSVLEKMGPIDILVNCAGFIRQTAPADFPERDWDATLEVNLTAAFILCQAAGREMLKKGKGKIINIASGVAFRGGANVAYTSSKHGIAGLTKCLANDWAEKGVNVNAIAPGFFITEFTEPVQRDPERTRFITSMIPAGRWGNPEDIAGPALFLASPASDYLHGVILSLDGGRLVR